MSIADLPANAKALVLSKLPCEDVIKVCATNHAHRAMCDAPGFWEEQYHLRHLESAARAQQSNSSQNTWTSAAGNRELFGRECMFVSGKMPRDLPISSLVSSVAFSPDGVTLAAGSHDKTATVFNVLTRVITRQFHHHGKGITSVAFSPDGRTLATGSLDNTAKLWRTDAPRLMPTASRTLQNADCVHSVAWSPDGRTLATAVDDSGIVLWDADTGVRVRELRPPAVVPPYQAWSVSFSPDGGTLAAGYGDTTTKLWDLNTGTIIREFHGHNRDVVSVAYSPDGGSLATGSTDKTTRLWDVGTGAETRRFAGHTEWVNTVAFGPGGRQIATGSWDKTAKLWDANTGAVLRTYAHTFRVNSVAFTPDGRTLATGSRGSKLWGVLCS